MISLFRFRQTKSAAPPAEESGTCEIGGKKIGYVIQRSARRKYRIAFYVESSSKLRFVSPRRTRTATIENILKTRGDWIAQKLEQARERPAPCVPQHFEDGETAYYLGSPYKLHIVKNSVQPQGCSITGDQLQIHLSGDANKEEARLELMLWYKKEAKRILKERTGYWAAKLKLKYRTMKVGNPLRQWGSCSGKNDIRYNWRVITGPMEAVDYLVVHELCHVVHKNHSPRFWNLVATVIPDHKKRRAVLHGMDTGFSL